MPAQSVINVQGNNYTFVAAKQGDTVDLFCKRNKINRKQFLLLNNVHGEKLNKGEEYITVSDQLRKKKSSQGPAGDEALPEDDVDNLDEPTEKKKKKKRVTARQKLRGQLKRGECGMGAGRTAAANRLAFLDKIALENEFIRKSLNKIYDLNPNSYVMRNKLRMGFDCNPLWKRRTSLYSEEPKFKNTGVPKTAGCLICHGCGRKSWFHADGRKLFRHPETRLWYCSEACAEIDNHFHPEMCLIDGDHKSSKHLKRTLDSYWIVNGTMVEGRRLLRLPKKRQPSIEKMMQKLTRMRKEELRVDQEERTKLHALTRTERDPLDPKLAERQPNDAEKLLLMLKSNVMSKATHARRKVNSVFKQYDKDNSGTIDYDEFSNVVNSFVKGATTKQMEDLFNTIDLDNSGNICKGEFADYVLDERFEGEDLKDYKKQVDDIRLHKAEKGAMEFLSGTNVDPKKCKKESMRFIAKRAIV